MKRNFVQYLTVASLCVASTSSLSVQAFKEHYGIGRGWHYETHTRENPQDAAHRNGIKAAIAKIRDELALIRPRFEAVKQEHKGVEAKLQTATVAFDKFRVENSNQVKAATQRKTQIEQSSAALARSKNLADLVEKLIAFSAEDFFGELSLECRKVDLNVDLEAPTACPAYAQADEACQLYRSFYEALDTELKQLRAMGLSIDRVIEASPTLRTFMAVQKNSAVDLGLVQRDVAQQSRDLDTKLGALKVADEASRAISAQLQSLEAGQRAALIDFDRSEAILRVLNDELKQKEGELAAREKELSGFKVRIEKYQVKVQSEPL